MGKEGVGKRASKRVGRTIVRARGSVSYPITGASGSSGEVRFR